MEWDIQGHAWAVKMLQQHIHRAEVRHAYLFSGAPGVGRRTLALRFAQALNCIEPPQPGAYCGVCRICKQTANLQHADVCLVEKQVDKKDIVIEQVRELQRMLSLTPYEARYRIAILRDFENANHNAQNALLKTLEEAPPKVILLITACAVENLLPTIVSRCEILRLHPMPLEELKGVLQRDSRLSADMASKIAHLAGGRLGYAQRMIGDSSIYETHAGWIEDLLTLLPRTRRERFAYVKNQFKKRERETVREAFGAWLSFWRDVLLAACGARVPLVNIAWEERIRRLAAELPLTECYRRVAALEQGIVRLDTTNINAQLLAEILLMD